MAINDPLASLFSDSLNAAIGTLGTTTLRDTTIPVRRYSINTEDLYRHDNDHRSQDMFRDYLSDLPNRGRTEQVGLPNSHTHNIREISPIQSTGMDYQQIQLLIKDYIRENLEIKVELVKVNTQLEIKTSLSFKNGSEISSDSNFIDLED